MLHLFDLCSTSSKADRVMARAGPFMALLLNTQSFYDLFDCHSATVSLFAEICGRLSSLEK